MRTMSRCLAAAITGAMISGVAVAAPVVIDINTFVTGLNGGTASVAKLTMTQNGANVDFRLDNTISNHAGAITGSFLTLLEFSYDGSPALTSANFTSFGGSQVVGSGDFGIDPPGGNAGYDFFLDLDYPTGPPSQRFVNGEYSTWTITGVNLNDFTTLVTGSGPASLAMVHLQGLNAGQSAKYVGDADGGGPPTGGVPEPATLALVGLALFAAARARRHS
jgi:hypothetical protein